MKISMKCLPVGDLPYGKIDLVTNMMIRLFEQSPFIALLPQLALNENVIFRTLCNTDFIKIYDKSIFLDIDFSFPNEYLRNLNTTYNSSKLDDLDDYNINSFFFDKYLKIIKRVQPQETVVNLFGPFSFMCLVNNYPIESSLLNKDIRKFVIQYFSLKALYIIKKITELSPKTKILIIFEEPHLKEFSHLRRTVEGIDNLVLISIYKRIFTKIHDNGAFVGIQCFEKCNWSSVIDSGVDLISFDAYNNPRNLNVIARKVNDFLNRGGYINWGIVPVKSEKQIKSLTIDFLLNKFLTATNDLIKNGVSADLLYQNSLVSMQGNTSDLPVIFAEKAMILANHLAQRVPTLK